VEIDRVSAEILKNLAREETAPPSPRRPPNPPNPPNAVDHWTPAVLLERAAYLRKLARLGDGSASESLREYPQHMAMLSYRNRSGEAEIHDKFADLFIILAGAATLVTGGAVSGARSIAPGETRADSIQGGATQPLRSGEVVHIPAGTPHQMLLSGDQTIAYFILKQQETPE
jgi:mannose-6-phosphate isomerase-like protein (cupin superfamily)